MDLLQERSMQSRFDEAVAQAEKELGKADKDMVNVAAQLYALFTEDELTEAICRRLLPDTLNAELKVVFPTCADLRRCIPNHTGDWYFTGNYPTPGGNRVVNQALLNYAKNINERAY
jgi:amidophosphoribosyltransferase